MPIHTCIVGSKRQFTGTQYKSFLEVITVTNPLLVKGVKKWDGDHPILTYFLWWTIKEWYKWIGKKVGRERDRRIDYRRPHKKFKVESESNTSSFPISSWALFTNWSFVIAWWEASFEELRGLLQSLWISSQVEGCTSEAPNHHDMFTRFY